MHPLSLVTMVLPTNTDANIYTHADHRANTNCNPDSYAANADPNANSVRTHTDANHDTDANTYTHTSFRKSTLALGSCQN